MEDICVTVNKLLKNPEDYLRPDFKQEEAWTEHARQVYNFTKHEERKYRLPAPPDAPPSLHHSHQLDPEQIWQLVELQNTTLLAAADDLATLGDTNLCLSVARLSSLAKMGKFTPDTTGQDEGIGASEEDSDVNEDLMEDDLIGSEDEAMNFDEEEIEEEYNDGDEDNDDDEEEDDADLEERLDLNGLDINFDNDTDDEVDNFDEFIAKEGQESESDEEGPNNNKRQNQTTTESNDNDMSKNKKKNPMTRLDVLRDNQKGSKSEEDSDASDLNDLGAVDGGPDRGRRGGGKGLSQRAFQKTSVDTRFFKLRESEWVADNDAIGDNFEAGPDDEIDMMAEFSDGSVGEEEAMYDAFFDAPQNENMEDGGRKMLSEMLETGEGDSDDEDDDEGGEKMLSDNIFEAGDDSVDEQADEGTAGDGVEERNEDQEDMEEEEGTTQLLGVKKKKERKSRLEIEMEREKAVMAGLEQGNIEEKPWYLRGEALTKNRPEDSALQERLEYDIAARPKPVITEDTTTLVERVILGRVRSKAWDDVERRVKPNIDPTEYKKKLLLDQDKSKKSLAQIYEEEYVKQQEAKKSEEGEEELPEHIEIRERMDSLFSKLDALANFHYTPSVPKTEVKIRSNLPAITLEEATPDTATSATLLAPQEVKEPTKGELVGATERTDTNRKRERRIKKTIQKKRAKEQEKRLSEKVKRASKTGKLGQLDKQTTLQVVQKAVKAGHVKMLEEGAGKGVQSSQSFFKTLQNQKQNQNQTGKKKEPPAKAKPNKDNRQRPSISKLIYTDTVQQHLLIFIQEVMVSLVTCTNTVVISTTKPKDFHHTYTLSCHSDGNNTTHYRYQSIRETNHSLHS
ncbi:hypothetical protein Pcinc_024808 [Petrolisthes cinctipes]|uniref:Uncharacterized protein n=1 Tax=Petrolisthes cinctipes TaxID=88211 RepID=A0AAE1FBX1_PETCI|nr:hypothetical protein Pcinc_024808 [Petrolisthes cinctipes]